MDENLPPGPPLPVWTQTVLLWRHRKQFLDACHRRYGDRFTVRAAGTGSIVFLADADDARVVFRADPNTAQAGAGNAVLSEVLGPASVLVLDGEQHKRRRRLMLPAFHGDSVRRQAELMADIAATDVETWPVGSAVALHPRMRAITLEVILRTVIGVQDEVRLAELRRVLPPLVDFNMLLMLPVAYPRLRSLGPWRRFGAVKQRAYAALVDEIERCRTDPRLAERTDVLAMLVRARDEDEQSDTAMSTDELRDQLVTLLLAGHETTATGLSWTFERLVRHPELLRAAQEAAEQGDDAYLDAVVKESLRVRPVVYNVARRLTAPLEVGGYRLPAGVMVAPVLGMVQRSAAHHPDPERFDPARYTGAAADPHTWMPFGGGTRRCLGATFASVEMRIVLREVLRRVRLETTDAAPERARARHVTLVPHRGARVTVHSRRPAPAVVR